MLKREDTVELKRLRGQVGDYWPNNWLTKTFQNSVKHVKQLLKYDYDPEVDDKEPPKPTPKKVQKKQQPRKKNVFRLKKTISDVTNTDSESSEEEEEVKEPEQRKEKGR